jgi:hypothetical protein
VEDGHNNPDDPTAPAPVALQVGADGEQGSFCAYWIDDVAILVKDPNLPPPPPIYHFPSEKFDHPARLAWTKQGDSSRFGVASVKNTLTVYLSDGSPPGPYMVTGDTNVAGVPVTFGTGEFAAEPLTPKGTSARRVPAPQQAGGCIMHALVIDGGDKKAFLSNGIAADAAADAELMNTWLAGRGFTVQRVSQYWGNATPAYGNGRENADFFNDIRTYVNMYAGMATGGNCHHEFFLYVSSHGGQQTAGFFLYDSDGSGTNLAVRYRDVFIRLNDFPTDAQHQTTVYAMFDACYSGLAIPSAQARFRVQPAANGHLGLQVVTAAGALHEAAAGHNVFVDSATEDFLEMPMTITTGFAVMVNDAGGRNPARLRLPDQAGAARFTLDP